MSNRGILIIIALIVIGILGLLVFQQREKAPLGERISDSVSETVEEIGDEIDDNTTVR
ncbi:MAG: hypothetical protein WC989_09510 [Micavibrio sp.]